MNKTTLCICLFGIVLNQTGCVVVSGSASNDSPSIDNSASDTAALIQQENDINAMNASMAAAEQQNEAAQQQTIQTEINAMPVDNSNL